MPWEQSKAAKRRFQIGAFHSRYFVGDGIDIGGKPDPLAQYAGVFAGMRSVRTWDVEDGDGQHLAGVPDASFDFLHASHSLEHMVDVRTALANWIRVVRPGGFLVITVPDEDLYEQGHWPSRFNSDHKWTFTIAKTASWSPRTVNVLELMTSVAFDVEVEKIELLKDFHREALRARGFDQTATPVAECAIEIIVRKRTVEERAVMLANARRASEPVAEDHAAAYVPMYAPWRLPGEFAEIFARAAPHTLVSASRAHTLYTLARQALGVEGSFVECGVFRGGTAIVLGEILDRAGDARALHLFDTFGGMPHADPERDRHEVGDFRSTSVDEVAARLSRYTSATLHPGLIPDTFSAVAGESFAFAHVDVDVHRSVLDCCEFLFPRMVRGGFMVFDDYGFPTCPGAREAVDDFFAPRSEEPLVLPTGQAVVFIDVR